MQMDNMAKKMLIDATHAEETRVVVVDGNKVEEFDFESENKRQLAGNIYLAKVTRVEPSLQAAFVEYGGNRHGFLAFSEIHPDYYQIPVADREALLAAEAAERQGDDQEAEEKPKRRRRSRAAKNESTETVASEKVEAAPDAENDEAENTSEDKNTETAAAAENSDEADTATSDSEDRESVAEASSATASEDDEAASAEIATKSSE